MKGKRRMGVYLPVYLYPAGAALHPPGRDRVLHGGCRRGRFVMRFLTLCLILALGMCTSWGASLSSGESKQESDESQTWKGKISLTYNIIGMGSLSSGDGSGSLSREGTFQLRGVSADTPMPSSAKDGKAKLTVKANTKGDFGEVKYTSPGVYQYEVSHLGKRNASVYRVTMVVRNDGDIQQVIETDGEKVTEIRYEESLASGDPGSALSDPLEIIKTGDLNSIMLPLLALGICSILLGLLMRKRVSPPLSGGRQRGNPFSQGRKRTEPEVLRGEPWDEAEDDREDLTANASQRALLRGYCEDDPVHKTSTEELESMEYAEGRGTILDEERRPLSEYWHTYSVMLVLLVGMLFASIMPVSAATKDLQVTYNRYEELPENYVKITGLPLQDAEITTTNSNIHKYNGYVGNNQTEKRDFVAYYGTVNFGTKNRNTTEDAVTASNAINGNIILRWSKKAILSDNTKADVKITVSGWNFYLGKNQNSKIKSSTKVYIPILQSSAPNSNATELCSSSPRTSYSTASGTTDNTLAGACIKTHCTVQIQILKAGTDEPIDSQKYPRMLFGFRDLDVADATIASGKSAVVRYNGAYTEGVEMISGFEAPVCLAQKSNTNPSMQTLEKSSIVNNNLRISGDGEKFEKYNNATGTIGDNGTYYSGFISPVTPQNFKFKWTGSVSISGKMLGTSLWNQPSVAVRATAGEGGTIQKEGTTTYILNSSTTYDYTPSPGYLVKSLTVEGKSVDFDENGGTYKFDKLYTSPVRPRSATTGEVTSTKVYTIDVQFQRIEHNITTKVTNGTIDSGGVVGQGEDKTIQYNPDDGYELEQIIVDGENVSLEDYEKQYTWSNVQADHAIEVVYSKIPVAKLTLRKQVTGALGDRSKRFEFQIALGGLKASKEYSATGLESAETGTITEKGFTADENGEALLNVRLKDDEEMHIEELPEHATYQVKEMASNHTASYQQTGTGETPNFLKTADSNSDSDVELSSELEKVDEEDGDIEITFTNDRPIAVVTGVGNSDVPYFVVGGILLALSSGWIIYVLKYRRRY